MFFFRESHTSRIDVSVISVGKKMPRVEEKVTLSIKVQSPLLPLKMASAHNSRKLKRIACRTYSF